MLSKDNQLKLIESINCDSNLQKSIIKHLIPNASTNKFFKTHEETTASSKLKLDGNKYWLKNFGNGESAKDWLNITQDKLQCGTHEALEYIIKQFAINGYSSSKSSFKREFSPFEKMLYAIENNTKKEVTEYLTSRGIDCIKLPSNSYFQSNNPENNSNALVFVDSEKRLINFRNLTNKKSDYWERGELNNSIYDALYKPEEDWIYLTEGCINALSIPQQSTIAFFTASNMFTDYEKLEPYIEDKTVVLAFDNDLNGNKIKNRILSLIIDHDLTEQPVYEILQPENKDLNKLLQDGELKALLEDTTNYKQLHPRLIENTKDKEHDLQTFGFYKDHNQYWVEDNIRGEKIQRHISTFIMDVEYFFPGEDASLILSLQSKFGLSKLCKIPIDSLELTKFKTFMRKQGEGLSFRGSVHDLDRIIESIHIGNKKVNVINSYGQQEKLNFYACANGIISNHKFFKVNKYGIVSHHNNLYYLAPFSKLETDPRSYELERKFSLRKGECDLKEWSELLVKAYSRNGMIGIMFTICAVFRDIIISELDFFPYLFLFGEADAGKTTFAQAMLSLFYQKNKGISLEGLSSPKSIVRTAHQYTNSLIYLKEFDQNVHDEICKFIKSGYEGVGYSRALTTNDNRTHETYINSAIMLDGNNMPAKTAALLSRMFVLFFNSQSYNEESYEAFLKLKDKSNSGFGRVLIDLLSQRTAFKKDFSSHFHTIFRQLKKDESLCGVTTRSINHLSLILAAYRAFNQREQLPFSYQEMYEYALEVVLTQDEDVQALNRINIFWEAIDTLMDEKQVKKDIHYCYTRRTDGKEFIALSIKKLHSLCIKNSQLFENLPKYNDLIRLITADPAYEKSWQQGRSNSVTVKPIGSAYAFDPEQVKLNLNKWQ